MGADASIPGEVLAAWGLAAAAAEPVSVGLINRTWRVRRAPDGDLALQELHRIFAAEVNEDIDAVTAHLERRGLVTPRPVRTRTGALWVEHQGRIWRALTWVEGVTHPRVADADLAREAGRLVGRFHRAVADLDHTFRFTRAGVHDTAAHLAGLESALKVHHAHPRRSECRVQAEAILEYARELHPIGSLPPRVVHGDLKITNLLFDDATGEGVALVDLDTLARSNLAVEMGDALRSWCNPLGEDHPGAVVDEPIFDAAVRAYAASVGDLLDAREIGSLVTGFETIAVELAARFCRDALEDRYFGWDSQRYESRTEHNLARADAQLSLAHSVAAVRDRLDASVREAFAG